MSDRSTRFQNQTSILTKILEYTHNLKYMVNSSFVLSVYAVKGDDEKRRVNYRQTNMRYLVVVIAILVVFGCEYCFDNPSVNIFQLRLCNSSFKPTWQQMVRLLQSLSSICYMHSMPSPTS